MCPTNKTKVVLGSFRASQRVNVTRERHAVELRGDCGAVRGMMPAADSTDAARSKQKNEDAAERVKSKPTCLSATSDGSPFMTRFCVPENESLPRAPFGANDRLAPARSTDARWQLRG